MRVIAMKNRRAEFTAMKKALSKLNPFPSHIVPYVEIIHEENYDVSDWSKLFENRPLFIDYLRCDLEKYPEHVAEKAQLVYKLNTNLPLYKNKLLALNKFQNVIPVVAIRQGIDNYSPSELDNVITDLRQHLNGRPIALRIEDFEGYENVLRNTLLADDYLFYDISEQPFKSKILEHQDLSSMNIRAHRGILCSPRKRNVKNGDYQNGPTLLIDCSGEQQYRQHQYEFYADYGGLKDNLPSNGGGGKGSALALLFDKNLNQFHSYVNKDTSAGLAGYSHRVIPAIIADSIKLDPNNTCLTLAEIHDLHANGKSGNWESWIKFTLLRTVQQLA